MNICIGVLLCFAVLGLADKILGGRLGVAAELDRGLAAMGSLSLSMTGIYCLIITAMSALEGGLSAVSRALPFDASLAAGMLLAPDMAAGPPPASWRQTGRWRPTAACWWPPRWAAL